MRQKPVLLSSHRAIKSLLTKFGFCTKPYHKQFFAGSKMDVLKHKDCFCCVIALNTSDWPDWRYWFPPPPPRTQFGQILHIFHKKVSKSIWAVFERKFLLGVFFYWLRKLGYNIWQLVALLVSLTWALSLFFCYKTECQFLLRDNCRNYQGSLYSEKGRQCKSGKVCFSDF